MFWLTQENLTVHFRVHFVLYQVGRKETFHRHDHKKKQLSLNLVWQIKVGASARMQDIAMDKYVSSLAQF